LRVFVDAVHIDSGISKTFAGQINNVEFCTHLIAAYKYWSNRLTTIITICLTGQHNRTTLGTGQRRDNDLCNRSSISRWGIKASATVFTEAHV
jgi:hypothetical protein